MNVVLTIIQRTPWVPFLSILLPSCFLLLSFINLAMSEESGAKQMPLRISVSGKPDEKGFLFDPNQRLHNKLAQSVVLEQGTCWQSWPGGPLLIGPVSLKLESQSQLNYHKSNLMFEPRRGLLEGVIYLMIAIVVVALPVIAWVALRKGLSRRYALACAVNDFTARKDEELALPYQATYDELTGALNRRGLQNCIHNRLLKGDIQFTFFCMDIRSFSKLISAFGLSISDQLLQAFHTELFGHMNMHGEISRVHLDHFVVMLNQSDSLLAEEAYDTFLQRIDSLPFELDGRSIRAQVLPTLVFLAPVDNALDVMEILEVSMREAKLTTKRNNTLQRIVFEQSHTSRLLEQSRTIRSLCEQKLPPGLTLAWQPILSLEPSAMVVNAEALLRIRGDDGELKSALFLLEACERGGHTAFLDNWVLSQTLEFLTENVEALKNLSALSVNVSPSSLNNEVFLQNTLTLVSAHKAHASKLCLEITEVGSVSNLQAVQTFIDQIRGLGVRIALDDFGAGYSNFRYALDLHADVIKIDGSIIKNICHSTESYAVTAAIVRLAHDLGCKCVAEWVEDLHTLRQLKALGVDFIQGYLVSNAVESSHFLNLINPLDLVSDMNRGLLIQDVVESAVC